MNFETRVIFFQIQESRQKLKILTETVRSHFEKKEPILLFVEEEKALNFVDELLWKEPRTSFLPHGIFEMPTHELVVITKGKKNLNQAHIAFNLCTTPLFLQEPLKILYEFEDLSSPSKKKFSLERFTSYKSAHYAIEAR